MSNIFMIYFTVLHGGCQTEDWVLSVLVVSVRFFVKNRIFVFGIC